MTHVSKPIPGRKTADRGLSPSRQTHLGLMLCMSALFAATLSTSPANRRFGYTDRRAGADQNHLPSSIRAIRTTSHAAGASSATCTSPSQERQLTCSCVAAGISTLRAGVPRLRGEEVSARRRACRLLASDRVEAEEPAIERSAPGVRSFDNARSLRVTAASTKIRHSRRALRDVLGRLLPAESGREFGQSTRRIAVRRPFPPVAVSVGTETLAMVSCRRLETLAGRSGC